MKIYVKFITATFLFAFIFSVQAQTLEKNILEGVTMSGDWFIANSNTKSGNDSWENEFKIKRSYFTLKKEFNDVFYVRYTQDIAIDKEGSDAGNVETRMKYLYLKIKPKWNTKFVTGNFFEIGMIHRPWITYEQEVNVYRVQGNMPGERNGLYNSAGFGVLFGGNIGPKMDKDYLNDINESMPGKYASFAIGIYNGGGYASFEENSNKVFEGTLHFRPFANSIPQIQLTHGFNYGKGNTIEAPEFTQNLLHLGYMGKYLILTGQYQFGKGDFRGDFVDSLDASKSLSNEGYSFFVEYKIKNSPFAAFLRYDNFEVTDLENNNVKRQLAGFKYSFYQGFSLVLTGEKDTFNIREDETNIELNLQISF